MTVRHDLMSARRRTSDSIKHMIDRGYTKENCVLLMASIDTTISDIPRTAILREIKSKFKEVRSTLRDISYAASQEVMGSDELQKELRSIRHSVATELKSLIGDLPNKIVIPDKNTEVSEFSKNFDDQEETILSEDIDADKKIMRELYEREKKIPSKITKNGGVAVVTNVSIIIIGLFGDALERLKRFEPGAKELIEQYVLIDGQSVIGFDRNKLKEKYQEYRTEHRSDKQKVLKRKGGSDDSRLEEVEEQMEKMTAPERAFIDKNGKSHQTERWNRLSMLKTRLEDSRMPGKVGRVLDYDDWMHKYAQDILDSHNLNSGTRLEFVSEEWRQKGTVMYAWIMPATKINKIVQYVGHIADKWSFFSKIRYTDTKPTTNVTDNTLQLIFDLVKRDTSTKIIAEKTGLSTKAIDLILRGEEQAERTFDLRQKYAKLLRQRHLNSVRQDKMPFDSKLTENKWSRKV